ncbi:hypothetical protein E1H12_16200 [Geitlerinema sp. P-1104]|uniref:alanine:cation symporter family protein n=1 Tax=Geitlerinema sp. P-1104 TaxID=2546230 RepID=UPI0014770101|nr:alanine:cation symporter family protein [Geitlerinema sp. P-1104]NMG60018.1 hypothetical protein [Geitlerinema sp. P-1104]
MVFYLPYPFQTSSYILAALWIILTNISEVPSAFGTIISGACTPKAVEGGFIGVLIKTVRRPVFSSEAGIR